MLFSTAFQLYVFFGGQCTYPCFPGILLISTPYNIHPKSKTAFLHNHCQNNGQQWQKNEFCRNDYHQSYETILAKQGDQTSDLLSSPVPTDLWGFTIIHWKDGSKRTNKARETCQRKPALLLICQVKKTYCWKLKNIPPSVSFAKCYNMRNYLRQGG